MIVTYILLGVIVLLVVACFLVYKNLMNRCHEIDEKLKVVTAEKVLIAESIDSARVEKDRVLRECDEAKRKLQDELTEVKVESSRLRERLNILEGEKERIQRENELQFKELASKIFDDKTQKSEVRLDEILKPLKGDIERLNREINERAMKETANHASLKEQINMLKNLNEQISTDANNLAKALKGNSKIQGDWGEHILEQILEQSGLQNGVHFETQVTKDEDGKTLTNEAGGYLRPDVIVNFPDNKKVIIDSKVSLTSYVDFVNAEEKDAQDRALALHITSVRKHIDELATKKYQDYVRNAGDFVMMFIPNEGAYIAAMQGDSKLWEYAYNKHVVIISPTHLISVLKLVSQLWQHDNQTKNAIAIAESAGRLYDKFAGFVGDMESIDKALRNANDAYGKAMNKLNTGRGNIISNVEKLKEMGAKASKQLPKANDDDEA